MIDLPKHTAPAVSVATLAASYRAAIKSARDPAITDAVCAARCDAAAKIARQMAATPAGSAREAALKLRIARSDTNGQRHRLSPRFRWPRKYDSLFSDLTIPWTGERHERGDCDHP